MLKKKNLLHSLGLIISIVFIYFIFRGSNISEIISTIKKTNLPLAVIVATLSLVLIIIKTYRWKMILDKSVSIPYSDLLKINFTSNMFNVLLPFRAGEVIQVFLTRSKGEVSKSNIAGSLVLNKFLELLSILIIFCMLVIFINTSIPSIWLKPIKYLVVFSILFLVLFGFKIVDIQKIKEPSNKILNSIYKFFLSLTHIGDKTLLIKTLLLSLLVWAVELVMIYLLMLSFGIVAPLWSPILVLVGINLAMLIPATSGSFGPYEFSIMLVLGAFSVTKETAVAYAITLHFLEIIFVLFAGLICYVQLKDKKQIK